MLASNSLVPPFAEHVCPPFTYPMLPLSVVPKLPLNCSTARRSSSINMEHLPAMPIVLLKSISEVPACEVLVLVCFFCEPFFFDFHSCHSCIQKAPVLHVGPWQLLCEAPAAMLGSSALCGAVYSLAFTASQARRGWDLFEVRLIQNAPKPTIWDGF